MGENDSRYYGLRFDQERPELIHLVDPDGKVMVPGQRFDREQMAEICIGLNTAFRDGLAAGRRSVPDAISWADVEMLQQGPERFRDLADRLAAVLPPQRR